MNEAYFSHNSSTFSHVLLAAGLITCPLTSLANEGLATHNKNISHFSYSSECNMPTYDSMRSQITGTYSLKEIDFEQSISSFYINLLAHQEPLGAEFEKVLYENLWDLYES